ncbi:MAG: helix-turn-helix domain-containing protein, partial [Pseudonocardiaceae bacterium]
MQPFAEKAPDGSVGHRVAVARKLAGLTQQQLATRAHVSKSLVSHVERGLLPASPAFIAAVARALGVEVDTLTGEPYGPAITDPQAEHAAIPALRAALDCDEDPDLDSYPMSAA